MEIILVFPGKIWGGAEQYVLDLGKALQSAGHHVRYIANPTRQIEGRLKEEAMEVEYFAVGNILNIKSLRHLAKCLGNADIMHIHDVHHVPWAIAGKKLAKADTRIFTTRHIARGSRTMPWDRPFFNGIEGIIFVSGISARLWQSKNRWMPDEKCHVVLNSVADNRQEKPAASLRRELKIGRETPLLAFTGRVRKSKGCEVIVRALSLLKDHDFHMVFIGNCKPDNFSERLMQLAKEAGIADKITIYGFSSNIKGLLGDIEIGLAPSIVREACPLSPMEYMQAGIPVIASDNGGQIEYIKDGVNGILIPPDDAESLANAIKRLLDNPGERQQIGKNAKEYFEENMSYPKFVNKITTLYKS